MAINAISGGLPPIQPTGISNKAAQASPDKPGNFGEMLKGYIEQVDREQQSSAGSIGDLLTGKSQDTLGVVNAMAKADLSFKLLLGVRNKVIEAYKQTINMQV